jgi:anti-sigma-K factor RskA
VSSERHVDELALWYVSGGLLPAERANVEAHLQTCAACRAAMDDARVTLAALATGEPPVAPAPALKQRLMARVDADVAAAKAPMRAPAARIARPPYAPAKPETPGVLQSLLAWWYNWAPGVAALSVVLTIALLVWNLSLQQQVATARTELALFTDPGLRIATLPVAGQSQPTSAARLYSNPSATTAILLIFGAKRLNSDQTYEFWLIRNGQAVPAGIFNADPAGTGRLVVRSSDAIGNYDQAGITIERAGGASTPNMNALVFVGPIK